MGEITRDGAPSGWEDDHVVDLWGKYVEARGELVVIVGALADFLAPHEGREAPTEARMIAYHQVVKLFVHLQSLLRLAPTVFLQWKRLDIFSSSLLARAVIDGYANFHYFGVDDVPAPEMDFRVLVWRHHEYRTRLKGVRAVGSTSDEVLELAAEADRLRARVVASDEYEGLSPSGQRVLRRGSDARLLGNAEVMRRADVSEAFYRGHYVPLSDYVHGFGMAASQLDGLNRNRKPIVPLFKLRLQAATAFACRTLVDLAATLDDLGYRPSPEVLAVCDVWLAMMSLEDFFGGTGDRPPLRWPVG